MHAICDAIIAGFLTHDELLAVLGPEGPLDDPLQLPSLSNFESFFLLKAFGTYATYRPCERCASQRVGSIVLFGYGLQDSYASFNTGVNVRTAAVGAGLANATEQAKYLVHRHWAGEKTALVFLGAIF